MRNILWYYYQIRCDETNENKQETIIKSNGDEYIFKELTIPEDLLKQIVEILYFNQIPSFIIVINKDKSLITKYNDKDFVLLKKIPLLTNNFIDLTRIEVKIDKNDIGATWSKKIDYFMLQLNEFGINKEMLINSFNYYVGMAENAIAMANRINDNNIEFQYVIQHARLSYPLSHEKYYDPTTMVIDIRIRDLSEFIKAKFFNNNITIDEIDRMVKKYNINANEANMLYARLFYPSYYFDLFEDMVVDEEDEEKIFQILKKRKDYEQLLREFYDFYKNSYNIYDVEWLKKEL